MLKCPRKHLEKRKVARQEPARERTVLTSARSCWFVAESKRPPLREGGREGGRKGNKNQFLGGNTTFPFSLPFLPSLPPSLPSHLLE